MSPVRRTSGDAAAPPADDDTFSVLEINEGIKHALKRAFPTEVWVRGEIKGIDNRRRGPHLYFELVEKDTGSADVSATLNMTIFKGARATIDRRLAEGPGMELADGVEVRVRGRVDFYPPFGKTQLIISDIDPAFTLGRIAEERERVLAALRAEGLLERNRRLTVPALPLRVGLVTSIDSAAYRDVVHEFERSGFGFRITAVDARVQGAQAVPTVVAALRTLARRDVDVVIVTRGGGSRTDLAGFDAEAVARAIAAMPVPVFTGIGHEIDVSVADLVAGRHFKTPTATAAAVVELVREFVDGLDERWRRIVGAADLLCARAEADGAATSQRIVHAAGRTLAATAGELRHRRTTTRLLAGARLDRATTAVAHAERLVAASDPSLLLARGWSITRGTDGRAIRSVADVAAGAELHTTVADGTIVSVVSAAPPDVNDVARDAAT